MRARLVVTARSAALAPGRPTSLQVRRVDGWRTVATRRAGNRRATVFSAPLPRRAVTVRVVVPRSAAAPAVSSRAVVVRPRR